MISKQIPSWFAAWTLVSSVFLSSTMAQQPMGTHAKDGSGIYGYRGTPIQPWSGYCVHDPDRPVPKKVDPGNANLQQAPASPPSDAIVLFDRSDLSQWKPSSWIVKDGYMECAEKRLITKREFSEGQLHIDWRVPDPPIRAGNNGIRLLNSNEIQIFDSITTAISTQHTQRWEVTELSFNAEAPETDPFAVEFGAVFSHADGTTLRIPGFYDGDDQWRIRFCPPETGEWSCVTFCSLPELAGHISKLLVTENTSEGRRGPIIISESNRQRFTYADGAPYPLMAFELDWLFALDAENPDDIPRTRQIVSEVAKHGFNQIVMNVFAYDAGFGEKDKIRPQDNYAQPKVFPFGGHNDHPDFSTIDTTFFQRLDRVLAHLNEKGIVAHLMIYVWNKKVNWPEPESAADNRYFDYVVKRYQAFPNLIWDISKEALGYGRDDMGYITRRIERLRRLDGHGRLVTVHDYDYCSAHPEKVDFISIQEWQPYLYSRMREVAAVHPGKPIFNIEHGGYEKTKHTIFDGAYTDPVTCLDRTWQCIFAGTYPTYYWQNAAWYHVITDPFGLPEREQPHFRFYRHLVDFLTAHPLLRFRPRQEAFTPPILEDSTGVYLFYLSDNRTGIYGNLPEVKGKTCSIAWFDPLTGEYYDGGEREFPEESPNAFLGIRRHAKITGPMAIAILKEIQ